jgi:ABC-type dipeptide/oligopeptide/nickel transport system ATPase component
MVEVTDLHMHFGAVRALTGVSFVAPDGAITGLVGANGAGKTTTRNIVSGLCERSAHCANDLIWIYCHRAESSVIEFLLHPIVLVWLFVVTPFAAAAAMWSRRRLLRELNNLKTARY